MNATNPPAGPQVNRRGFLALLAAAGVGVAQSRGWAAPAPVEPLTLGFSTYGMKGMKTEEAIGLLAGIGYDAVELALLAGWDMDPSNVPAARRTAIKRQLADAGMVVSSLMENLPPVANPAEHEAAMDRLKAAAQMAHDLSPDRPPLIETVLGGSEWTKSKPLFLQRLADWKKLAESHATVIAIKPHRMSAMSRPAEAIELFRELGASKWLRMVYDYSHYALREMPLAETIRTSLPWTSMVCVKDVAEEKGKAVFKLAGETGQIDYPALLRQFYAGGYRGDVNCEVSAQVSKEAGFDPVRAAKTCYTNMATAFVAANVPRPKRG